MYVKDYIDEIAFFIDEMFHEFQYKKQHLRILSTIIVYNYLHLYYMNQKLFKVDIHTHILPERIPKWVDRFGYSGFIELHHHKPCKADMIIGDKFFREIDHNCWNPTLRMKECDVHGVDVQVLSTIPVLFHYWAKPQDALQTSQFFNDHIAEVVRMYPKRFVGLGTLPIQDPQLAIGEMIRCKEVLGLAGVEIGSHINDWNLENENLYEFYAEAEKREISLFVHPWDMMGSAKMQKYWLPWLVGMPAETSLAICSMIFGGIFEKFPKLKVAFAHGGGSFPATIGRIEHGFNVRPDLVAIDNKVNPRAYLGKFYLDSLVHDPRTLEFNINLFGADKIALGSDYPFPLGELLPGNLIENMGYDRETMDQLLHKSAFDWLNLNSKDFK